MTHYVFEKVKLYGRKRVPCAEPGCPRKLTRTKVFWQTLNPFNKNPDGTVRTEQDILIALDGKRTTWLTEPEWCKDHAGRMKQFMSRVHDGNIDVQVRDGKVYF